MSADLAPTVRELSGWGRTSPTVSSYVEPSDRHDLLASVRAADPSRGTIARGLGRSYGDPAQNAGGCVLGTSRLDRVLGLDTAAGTVTVEAGVSIGRLCRRLLSEKMFVPVTPGTRAVTVGGAIAADVHGKNHHRDGAFGRHVLAMTLLLADGDVRVVTPQPDGDPELFWGTLGGMGLTGVVLDATVRTLPVQSPWMSVDTRRAESLDALLALLAEADQRRYSVAWVDCLARGRHAGRGVVTSAEHAGPDDVAAWGSRPPDPDPPARVRVPGWTPPGLLNRWTVAAFNQAWYGAAPTRRQGERQSPARFFHPLDAVDGWNRLYGPRGLVQYQCVVPDTGALETLLAGLRTARAPSFLAVLKRFGAADPGPLSFPRPGWTLALDLPARTQGLSALLDRLDETVAAAGGSVYLAKDSRMRPELLPVFYPGLDRWHALRDRVDPGRRWRSDQSRRLSL